VSDKHVWALVENAPTDGGNRLVRSSGASWSPDAACEVALASLVDIKH
jgi:hypothetical protein